MSNLKKFYDQSYIHFVTFNTFGKMVVGRDGEQYYKGHPYFKDEKCCLILLEEFEFYREKLGFRIYGYVIMPDHVHILIWWDIEERPDLTIGKILGRIKEMTSKRIKKYLLYNDSSIDWQDNISKNTNAQLDTKPCNLERLGLATSLSLTVPDCKAVRPWIDSATSLNLHDGISKQVFQLWQHGTYDFNIFTLEKYREKLDYMHYNPVKAGLVEKMEDYRWSSSRSLCFGGDEVFKVDEFEI